MTNDQIHLVQTTFRQIEPQEDTVAGMFYSRLFEIAPEVRPLFKGDMKEQGSKLMGMLGTAVKSLDRIEDIAPAIRTLGRRHAAYGVVDEHYAKVGEALQWTLERGLGDEFTAPVREAWTTVYGVLAATMQEGAR